MRAVPGASLGCGCGWGWGMGFGGPLLPAGGLVVVGAGVRSRGRKSGLWNAEVLKSGWKAGGEEIRGRKSGWLRSWSGKPARGNGCWNGLERCHRCDKKCEVRNVSGAEPEDGCRRPVLFVYVGIGAGQLNDGEGISSAAEVDHRSISNYARSGG